MQPLYKPPDYYTTEMLTHYLQQPSLCVLEDEYYWSTACNSLLLLVTRKLIIFQC